MLKSVAEKSESSMHGFSEVDVIIRSAATLLENILVDSKNNGIIRLSGFAGSCIVGNESRMGGESPV